MRRLLTTIPLFAVAAVACTSMPGADPPSAPSPAVSADHGAGTAVDLSKHSVPLEDIHFDTFDGGSIPLSEITPARAAELLDAIPPIDRPRYQPAPDGAWLGDGDLVIGFVASDGSAWAYPHKILNWHEIVNDTLAGVPVLITYCPLCRSGIVYDRRVGGRSLSFGNTSALYDSDMVMVDRETSSYWWQVAGSAIVGTLTGEMLVPLSSSTMTWRRWRNLYPRTMVLSRDTGHERPYERDAFDDYQDAVNKGRFAFPVGEAARDERLPAGVTVVGVSVDGESVAFPLERLGTAVARARIGGRDVVVFSSSDGPAGAAFFAEAGGRSLTFERSGGRIRDRETGSTWTMAGRATEGPLAGTRLARAPSRSTFWFAYVAAFPSTRVWSPSS